MLYQKTSYCDIVIGSYDKLLKMYDNDSLLYLDKKTDKYILIKNIKSPVSFVSGKEAIKMFLPYLLKDNDLELIK